MFEVSVNLVGVIVATVASMIVGMLWYSPVLFGKQWMAAMNLTPEKMKSMKVSAQKAYAGSALSAIVMSFVLAMLFKATGTATHVDAVLVAGLAWLGFVVTTKLTDVLFEDKNKTVFLLGIGYQLASLLAMGLVLVSF